MESNTFTRAAGYVRVSTDRQVQEGHSLAEQERRIRAHCADLEWVVAHIYRDEANRGADAALPEWNGLTRGRACRDDRPLESSGRLHRAKSASFAGWREVIAQLSVMGQSAKAAKGLWPGGEPPYGLLCRPGGELDIRPKEAEVVRLVAPMMLDSGMTTVEVAEALNARVSLDAPAGSSSTAPSAGR